METRIVVHKPDYAGDIKVSAQVKHAGFFSKWEQVSFKWVMKTYTPREAYIEQAIDLMKKEIDLLFIPERVIIYPENQK